MVRKHNSGPGIVSSSTKRRSRFANGSDLLSGPFPLHDCPVGDLANVGNGGT